MRTGVNLFLAFGIAVTPATLSDAASHVDREQERLSGQERDSHDWNAPIFQRAVVVRPGTRYAPRKARLIVPRE